MPLKAQHQKPEDVREITFNNESTAINGHAFSNHNSLEKINFPNNCIITSIGDYAFYNCISLPFIDIPDSITHIENSAFSGCTALKSITIPKNVTRIAPWTFSFCIALASVTVPNGVTDIAPWAFGFCNQLSSIKLPDSIKNIGNSAFRKCTALKSMKIPDSVTNIGKDAFNGCNQLTEFKMSQKLLGKETSEQFKAHIGLSNDCTIKFKENEKKTPVQFKDLTQSGTTIKQAPQAIVTVKNLRQFKK